MRHSGYYACGIPDGDTIVMTGGKIHNHVERWQPTSSLSYKNTSIKFLFLCTNRLDCNKFYFMASPSPICMETSASPLILSQVQCKWLCRGTSPTARKQTKTRLRCPSFHQGETCQTNDLIFPGIYRCWGLGWIQCPLFCAHPPPWSTSLDSTCLLAKGFAQSPCLSCGR